MESLEDAFIAYLEDAAGLKPERSRASPKQLPEPTRPAVSRASLSSRFDLGRLWAYARRETMEILRDPIRLAFSLLGPLILMVTVGYGISFDVEHLAYAAFDQDQTNESRELLENFSGSRYFAEHPDISSETELEHRLKSGELKVARRDPAELRQGSADATSSPKSPYGSTARCRSGPTRRAVMSRGWR